jgi:shikimate kinase/3-dehydroquinate synthase
VTITPGEPSKTLATVSRLWDEALSRGIDRDAVVLAFGGGVVGDLAGFTASTVLRGVRCVQVPTSLLAMVDSSVGGKTGFDHAAGKNLIGAFFQPTRVLLDLEHLVTLPPRERAAGLAEVVKIALVQSAELLELLEATAGSVHAGDREALRSVVRAAVAAKIRVVRDDERESGARALLNLGHTVGHALESQGQYTRLLHGEAVAIGTVAELAAAERLGLSPPGVAERARALLERLGLPTSTTEEELAAAWPFVLADKKRAASSLKLPVVSAPGAGVVARVGLDELRRALLAGPGAP